ncbi:hypothetical protein [Haliea sp. E17]|uniref:hypothetical protein n=1 Tax=Haliea sp. E17 TaxID=3401576 RepID=UPI003AABB85E
MTDSLSESVNTLVNIMKGLVDRGVARADVTAADWDALADVVDTASFQRIGPFHDIVDWAGYTALLTEWVNQSEGWDPVVKRLSESADAVFMQCEEMITSGDTVFPFYSLSMYEFNPAGKIQRISVYMQKEGPVEY